MTALRPLSPCRGGSCVSTQAPRTDPLRRVEPLSFSAPAEAAMRAVLVVLGRTPRTRVLERDDRSLHAIVRSAWLRIPLDVEIILDERAGLLHVRVSTPVAFRERSRARTHAVQLLDRIDGELRRA